MFFYWDPPITTGGGDCQALTEQNTRSHHSDFHSIIHKRVRLSSRLIETNARIPQFNPKDFLCCGTIRDTMHWRKLGGFFCLFLCRPLGLLPLALIALAGSFCWVIQPSNRAAASLFFKIWRVMGAASCSPLYLSRPRI